MSQQKREGRYKRFNHKKGYGFIELSDGSGDVFFQLIIIKNV